MVRPAVMTAATDRAAATAQVLAEDGFNLGVLYRGERAPVVSPASTKTTLADIERQFAIGA